MEWLGFFLLAIFLSGKTDLFMGESYFFLEGIYFLVLALIPMQLGIFRNLITFLVMILWLTVYFTDFVINLIYLNVVSVIIFFLIYPSVYNNDDSN